MTVTTSPDPDAQRGRNRPRVPASYDRASWRESAACRLTDTDVFFPVGKSGLALVEIQEAKAVCQSCPVRQPCLEFALETHQGYGIWGGYDEDERRLLRRQRQGP